MLESDGPLSSVNLLITRPVMPASRTATRVAALGATPMIFPTLVIEPPADGAPLKVALGKIGDYYAALFVSPSAAEMALAPMSSVPFKLQLRCTSSRPALARRKSFRGWVLRALKCRSRRLIAKDCWRYHRCKRRS